MSWVCWPYRETYVQVNKNKFNFFVRLRALLLLHLVQVVSKVGHGLLQPLTLLGVNDDLVRLGVGSGVQRITGHDLPVVKHALWEGLSTGLWPQIGSESWETREYKLNSMNEEDWERIVLYDCIELAIEVSEYAYQMTRWRAGMLWRRTWEFLGSVPLQRRDLSSCSDNRKYLRRHSRDTAKGIKI